MKPDPLPALPPDIARRKLSIIEYDGILYRTHSIHHSPIFFGNSRLNRFDAANESYRVLYAALDPYCAFIETMANTAGTRVITTTALKERSLAALRPRRKLRLIDPLVQAPSSKSAPMLVSSPEIMQSRNYGHAPCTVTRSMLMASCIPVGWIPGGTVWRYSKIVFPRSKKSPAIVGMPLGGRGFCSPICDHYNPELIETRSIASKKPAARQKTQELRDPDIR